ncbi:PTS mannose/fructose/sorbose/N-acetylgalactosamine transporter subunit IIC [Lacticaseibacillus paracasei]|uniref:PTS sugar transporter subunit IIC n=1 Tax=Lacticaseibacillus paracasei TaxID=1597 RepID=A0ABD5D000_LACPA|nr:PTS sugar transporter subunit IIC [Lacticaseibacillus paracasei]EPC96476.1 Mannose-specific pts system component iicd [Lacticaseibacillus paracasei subsp. paracasei CNCM I-4649]MDR7625467.1 PTS sugar transporter subunit IIC [Lacticaseibacillus paracasei]QPC14824.1 PTS sugar transporter subunit IIC [Lacticaseibacillus paracasei subsp. tolerans]QUT00106.1 PTS sugar transporter subunit IIC [Lacticaseibacillus paracasei subsp. tolerans]WMX61820.1 PTS sugar transporter subunit IIC [Lacticaseibac
MKINLIQAILIGIIYYLSVNGTPWLSLLGSTVMARPLICGTFVGFILGDPVQGCIYGAAISLPYLAYISAGGTVPMDPGLAGTLGTALAMAAKASPSIAVTLAVPIGLLGTVIWIVHMTVDISFLHMIDNAAENADIKKADRIQMYLPQVFLFLITVVPVMIIVYFGSGAVSSLLSSLSGTPLHILNVIGGVLPALGIAMILQSINNKHILIYYFIGVVLAVYLNLPIIAVSVVGFIIAFLYTQLLFSKAKEAQ